MSRRSSQRAPSRRLEEVLSPRDLVRSGAPLELLWALQQQQMRCLQLQQSDSEQLHAEVQRHERELRDICSRGGWQRLHKACAHFDYDALRLLTHELHLQQLRLSSQ